MISEETLQLLNDSDLDLDEIIEAEYKEILDNTFVEVSENVVEQVTLDTKIDENILPTLNDVLGMDLIEEEVDLFKNKTPTGSPIQRLTGDPNRKFKPTSNISRRAQDVMMYEDTDPLACITQSSKVINFLSNLQYESQYERFIAALEELSSQGKTLDEASEYLSRAFSMFRLSKLDKEDIKRMIEINQDISAAWYYGEFGDAIGDRAFMNKARDFLVKKIEKGDAEIRDVLYLTQAKKTMAEAQCVKALADARCNQLNQISTDSTKDLSVVFLAPTEED